MESEGTEGRYKEHIVGRPLCLFSIVSYPEKEGARNKYVNEIFPCVHGADHYTRQGLVGMIDQKKNARAKEYIIGPFGRGRAIESDP